MLGSSVPREVRHRCCKNRCFFLHSISSALSVFSSAVMALLLCTPGPFSQMPWIHQTPVSKKLLSPSWLWRAGTSTPFPAFLPAIPLGLAKGSGWFILQFPHAMSGFQAAGTIFDTRTVRGLVGAHFCSLAEPEARILFSLPDQLCPFSHSH